MENDEESRAVMSEKMRAFQLATDRRASETETDEAAELPEESAGVHVGGVEAACMLAFAATNDILDYFIVGSIPIVGDVLDGITWGAISAWVLFRGIDRPQSSLFAGAIELIPFGDLLPTYTLMVAGIVIYNNRAHA